MTAQTFAAWVAPAAAELRETRAEAVRVARQLLPEHWALSSPLPGWSYQDLLAHLATGDWVFQTILGAVTRNEPLDLSATSFINPERVAAANERLVAERRGRSVDARIAEVEAEGRESLGLLAKLSDDDEGRTQADAPMSLGEYVRGFPNHDREHITQLRTALDQVML
jgi:hypothetical protein